MDAAKPARSASLPRVAGYVRLHARRRPGYPAVAYDGRLVSYGSLHGHLQAMTQALRAFGLAPGTRVAVGHADLYVQLLIVFAFESLGIVTGSFRPDEGPECHSLLAGVDLTMSQGALPPGLCRHVFALTDAWVAAALACPVPADAAAIRSAQPEEAAIILRSSGTTGIPKRMVVTHAMLRTRLAHWAEHLGLNARSRLFSAMHFSMGTMYHSASACLRLGATFMFDFRYPLGSVLTAYRPTHLTLMPHQLGLLLDSLPETGAPLLPQLALSVIGARFSPELRQQTRARLCERMLETYGTNEAYLHAIVDPTGVGTVASGIDVEVVDDGDRPLPVGAVGWVRLRGAGVVRGYLDPETGSARSFRDGWFYPGDVAAFVAPGRLKLIGRSVDVLNIGGQKIACAQLEDEVLARAPVRDLAVLQGDVGHPDLLLVCVVVDGPADLATIGEAIRPVMKARFALQVVDAIPRTAEGKIRRDALRQSLADRARGQSKTAREPADSRSAREPQLLASTDS